MGNRIYTTLTGTTEPGQLLTVAGASSLFQPIGGTTVNWGNIQGTLSNQTDLQAALDAINAELDTKTSAALFSTVANGLVPASGGSTTQFLRGDGTWSTPANTGVWGQVSGTLSSQTDLVAALNLRAALTGATFTGAVFVPDDAYAAGWDGSAGVPTKNALYDKIESLASVYATAVHTHTISSTTGLQTALDAKANLSGATFTGDIIVPDEAYDATAWNGSMETPTKNAVRDKIEAMLLGSGAWGSITGNLTDQTDLVAALNAKQSLDATLTALAALSWSAGIQVPVFTAADTVSFKTVGAASGNLLDKAAGDALYQPLEATLTALAALNSTAGLVEQTGADTFTKRLIGTTNSTDILTKSGGDSLYALVGHNHSGTYQPLDATLTALAGVTTAADKLIYATGADTFSATDLSSVARTLLAQTTQSAMRSTGLGLGTSATVNTGTSGATIPLLNAANTFSAKQTFTADIEVSNQILLKDGATSAGEIEAFDQTIGIYSAGQMSIDAGYTVDSGLQINTNGGNFLVYDDDGNRIQTVTGGVRVLGGIYFDEPSDLVPCGSITAYDTGGINLSSPDWLLLDSVNTIELAINGVPKLTVSSTGLLVDGLSVTDDAYDATSWNGSLVVPTKNAIRDKIEGLSSVYQPLDATLTALAALNTTAGLVEQTGTDTFTKRAIGVAAGTSILTRDDGDNRFASISHATANIGVSGHHMATARMLGRTTASTGAIQELDAATVTANFVNLFSTTDKGAVPATGTPSGYFLKDDGTWAPPTATAEWGSIVGTLSDQSDLWTVLSAKAPTASPTFTGTVTLPSYTLSGGEASSDEAASKKYVHATHTMVTKSTTGGTTSLTLSEGTAGVIRITGTLTNNATFRFSSTGSAYYDKAYTVINDTTGSYTVTLYACAAPTNSVVLAQGKASLVYTRGDGIYLGNSDVTVSQFTSGASGIVPASGGGTTNFMRADGTWADPVATNSVALTDLEQIATVRVLGRATVGTGNVEALTSTQLTAMLNGFSSSLQGAVPASGGGTTNFLRADGTWTTPSATYDSPTFTGTVTVPTANKDTVSGVAASTSFVHGVLAFGAATIGGGTSTLTTDNAYRTGIRISGTLTSNATVSMFSGTSAGQNRVYVIRNDTTGAYSVTLQACDTSPSNSITIPQGETKIVRTSASFIYDITPVATLADGDKGDITVASSGTSWTIDNNAVATAKIADNAVTLAKLAQVATATFLGRTTASTGNVEALTATQATALLSGFVGDSGSGGTKGLVPAPATGDATKFLKGDGTWAAPAGLADGDKGDITVSASGATWTIDNNAIATAKIADDAVTYAKMQDISATSRVLGRITAGAGNAEELTGANVRTIAVKPHALTGGISGKPSNAQVFSMGLAPYDMTVAQANCSMKAVTASTSGSMVWTLKADSTTLGTFTFAASGTTATVSITSSSITAGQHITMTAPTTADATLATVGWIIKE